MDQIYHDAAACADRRERNIELTEINETQALADIQEGETLEPIIECYQLQFHHELARIMRNIDKACSGDKISHDAVMTACSQMQTRLLDASLKYQEE